MVRALSSSANFWHSAPSWRTSCNLGLRRCALLQRRNLSSPVPRTGAAERLRPLKTASESSLTWAVPFLSRRKLTNRTRAPLPKPEPEEGWILGTSRPSRPSTLRRRRPPYGGLRSSPAAVQHLSSCLSALVTRAAPTPPPSCSHRPRVDRVARRRPPQRAAGRLCTRGSSRPCGAASSAPRCRRTSPHPSAARSYVRSHS